MDHRCSIIANPEGKSWEFAQGVFEYLQRREEEATALKRQKFFARVTPGLRGIFTDHTMSEKLQLASVIYEAQNDVGVSLFEVNPLRLQTFPDEEYRSLIQNNIRGSNCFFLHDSNLRPKYWHSQLSFTDNALRNSSANRIINVLPYLKFSRQDRKDVSRTSINAQEIAKISVNNNAGVLTVDVHNKAIQSIYWGPAYSESFDSLESFPTLIRHLKTHHPELLEDLVVLCPDDGAMKRFEDYIEREGLGVASLSKYRDKVTKKIKIRGITGDDVSGKTVLIPDDIIASSSTQIAAGMVARDKGARKIIGYGTFALCTEGIEKVAQACDLLLIGDIIRQPYKEKLYTPNRPFAMPRNVEYVSFVPLIGEAIYRVSNHESLSQLFD